MLAAPPRRRRCASSRSCTRTCSTTTHVRGIVLNSRDVSERKAFEEQLAHQAFHDPVTDLANRALFVERVRHAVARNRREQQRHRASSSSTSTTSRRSTTASATPPATRSCSRSAERLATSIRASDTAARFGGDEFAVLLEDVVSAQEAADTAERILESLLPSRCALDQKELVVRSSLGISVVEGESPADADELIRNADAAMYIAKRDGKGGYRLFEPAMHEGVLARLELRADLQRAHGHRPARAALPAGGPARGRRRLRASRRCCAGATPSAASSGRTSSSRSPRRWA